MKKIYSFVLMAAMLLIGANAWASTRVVSSAEELIDEFDEAQSGDVIQLAASFTVTTADGLPLVLNDGRHLILDLNKKNLTLSHTDGTQNAGIEVRYGILEIMSTGNTNADETKGTLQNASPKTYDLIRIFGQPVEATELIDAKIAEPYSQVIVREGAKVLTGVASTNAITITQNTAGYAYGARLDVYGELKAEKYGIKVNGSVKMPAADKLQYSPYVYVAHGSKVATNDNANEAVAIYASGYARWRVEGKCQGSTGLYARAGQVEIVDATIKSTSEAADAPQLGKGSGVNAGGSAIVVESNTNYQGGIQVTIAGDTKVEASENGYAIQETVDTDDEVKVENITILSGTIQGGSAGAIVVSQKTIDDEDADVVILGGSITSENNSDPLQVSGGTASAQDAIAALIPGYDYTNPSATVPEVTPTAIQNQNTISVIKVTAGYLVTLNAKGLSTFSHEKKVKLPEGVTAWKATVVENEELEITKVAEKNNILPAETGLFLKGTPGESYTLIFDEGTPVTVEGNLLKPASAWDADNIPEHVYVLVGDELYKYTGTEMKPNKAYLQLDTQATSTGAPARIQMVIAETQDVENVEVEAIKAVKFIENGQVLIKRGETIYNVQGQIVK